MSGETMLERMAWAMAHRWALDDYEEEDARCTADVDWPDWVSVAKAALLAIREASHDALYPGSIATDEGLTFRETDVVWKAVIDAILNESPSPSVTHQTGDKT